MQKFFSLISVILFLSLLSVLPVLADPFSDVPQGHWAYDAVQMLEEKGLVEGYPDGLFKGERPMTRYEMAMIVARVIAKLEQVQSSIPEMPDLSVYATKTDLEAINKLIKEYGNELDALGVRVTNVEDTLGKLSGRVEGLERIKVSGTFESVGITAGASPESGNVSGPGTPDPNSHNIRPGFDRYLNPIGEAFKLVDGSALVSRLDLTVTAKLADKLKGGGNLIAYSAFGDKRLIECWGAMVPYNSTGVTSIWNQNFQANMGTLWVDSDLENWDFTIKFGEYNLNKVSKNLFYGQRSIIGLGGRDVYPLEGINITGKLYKTVDMEFFMARNSNVFRRVNDHSIYALGNPYNDGAGSIRMLTNGTTDPGLYDNYMYGAWFGYDYEKVFHIEGAFLRIYDDYANHPAPSTLSYYQDPRETKYFGFKGHYNIKENIKIYGEFAGTRFNMNMNNGETPTGKGYLGNIGAQVKLDNLQFYGEYDYTAPNYDPFSYHQTWLRAYTDGYHAGWDWKYGQRWGNAVRFGKFRANRQGFEGGLSYKFEKGDVYGDFSYLKQIEPTRNTLDENNFNIDPLTGLNRANTYGNQDSIFRYASDSKGSEIYLRVGGRYDACEKIHIWGMYDYENFQRDYAAATVGRVSDNKTDYSYHFVNTGVTYDLTDNFSVQGNLEYYKAKGIKDNGGNIEESQLIPGVSTQYRFSDTTSWILDYKFYSVKDDTRPADNNWDYTANRLVTRLEVKF